VKPFFMPFGPLKFRGDASSAAEFSRRPPLGISVNRGKGKGRGIYPDPSNNYCLPKQLSRAPAIFVWLDNISRAYRSFPTLNSTKQALMTSPQLGES
jgi:hypothetical protein